MGEKIEPYPPAIAKYPQGKVGYHNQNTRDKNLRELSKVGDVIILPKIKVREVKPKQYKF